MPSTADGLDFGGVATSPLGGPFGNVYVTDPGNHRVQEFDHNGVFIRQWGTTGTDDGQFGDAIDVAVGPTGLVYVVDDVRDDIQVFSPEGRSCPRSVATARATANSATRAPCSWAGRHAVCRRHGQQSGPGMGS